MNVLILCSIISVLFSTINSQKIAGRHLSDWLETCKHQTGNSSRLEVLRVDGYCEGVICVNYNNNFDVNAQFCEESDDSNKKCVGALEPFPNCCNQIICNENRSHSTIEPLPPINASVSGQQQIKIVSINISRNASKEEAPRLLPPQDKGLDNSPQPFKKSDGVYLENDDVRPQNPPKWGKLKEPFSRTIEEDMLRSLSSMEDKGVETPQQPFQKSDADDLENDDVELKPTTPQIWDDVEEPFSRSIQDMLRSFAYRLFPDEENS